MNIRELQRKLSELGHENYSALLEPYAPKLGEIHCVGVVGTSGSGKSTVINTIIGREIMPIGIIPSETKITLEHSTKEELILSDGSIHSLESADDLRGEVPEMKIHAQLHDSNIKFIEFPKAVGSEVESLTELYSCDCVILVMRAIPFMSINERKFISDYIKYIGPERIMIAVNKLPERESDRKEAIAHAERIIASAFPEVRYVFADSEGESLRRGIQAMLNTKVPVSSRAMREYIASKLDKELTKIRNEARKKGELVYSNNEDSFIINDALTQFGADANMAVKVLTEGITREISELGNSAVNEFRRNGRKWLTESFNSYITDGINRITSQYTKEANERLNSDTIRLSISLIDDSLEGSEIRRPKDISRVELASGSGHDWDKMRSFMFIGVPVAAVVVGSVVAHFSISSGIVAGCAVLLAGGAADFIMKSRNKTMNTDIERSIKLTTDKLSGEITDTLNGEIMSAYNLVEEEFRNKSLSIRSRGSYVAADENSETAEKIRGLEELIRLTKEE